MFLSHNIGADLSWVDGWVGATIFLVACRELRTSIMAPGELPIVKIFLLKKLGKRRTKVLLDFHMEENTKKQISMKVSGATFVVVLNASFLLNL